MARVSGEWAQKAAEMALAAVRALGRAQSFLSDP
jgi:hypothetical protein